MKKTKLMKVLSLTTVGVLLTGCSLDYNIYTREQFKAVNDKVLAVHKQDGYYFNHNFTISYNVTTYDSNGARSSGEQTTVTYGADSYYEVGAEVKLSAFYQKGVYDYSSVSIDTVSEVAASVDAYKDSASSTGSTYNEHTSIYDPETKEFVETDVTEDYNNQWF